MVGTSESDASCSKGPGVNPPKWPPMPGIGVGKNGDSFGFCRRTSCGSAVGMGLVWPGGREYDATMLLVLVFVEELRSGVTRPLFASAE